MHLLAVVLTLGSLGCGLRTGIDDPLASATEQPADAGAEAGVVVDGGPSEAETPCPLGLTLCAGDCPDIYVCVFGACPQTAPCGVPAAH
jgi:hypothetical protein